MGENPWGQGENMPTPHRKPQTVWKSNLAPSCCEARIEVMLGIVYDFFANKCVEYEAWSYAAHFFPEARVNKARASWQEWAMQQQLWIKKKRKWVGLGSEKKKLKTNIKSEWGMWEWEEPNSSRQSGLHGVIRLFPGLDCEIVIFPNGKVMVSQPILLQKDVPFSTNEFWICH